jgi:hypothetical protein
MLTMGCEVLIAVYGMTWLPRPAFAFSAAEGAPDAFSAC